MARNAIQLQKGLSLCELSASYGSEEKCAAAIFKWRWPDSSSCARLAAAATTLSSARASYICATTA